LACPDPDDGPEFSGLTFFFGGRVRAASAMAFTAARSVRRRSRSARRCSRSAAVKPAASRSRSRSEVDEDCCWREDDVAAADEYEAWA
jgi:hypothetical protein